MKAKNTFQSVKFWVVKRFTLNLIGEILMLDFAT